MVIRRRGVLLFHQQLIEPRLLRIRGLQMQSDIVHGGRRRDRTFVVLRLGLRMYVALQNDDVVRIDGTMNSILRQKSRQW